MATLGSTPQWMQARNCPKRDEIAFAALDGAKDVSIWFSIAGVNSPVTRVTSNATTSASRDVALAYEQRSGDLLAVYDDPTVASTPYRTALSGSLSGQSLIAGMATTSALRIIGLYPQANSDEILMLGVDGNSKCWSNIWNGSAWTSSVVLTSSLVSTATECFSGCYLNTGSPLIAYGLSGVNAPTVRTYSGGAWSSETNLASAGTTMRFIRLAAKPSSSMVVLAAIGGDQSLIAYTYDGSSWTGPTTMASSVGTTTSRAFDIAWLPDGSDAVLVYSKGSDTPYFKTFNGTSWSSESAGPTLTVGSAIRVVSVTPSAAGTDAFVLCSQANLNLWATRYTNGGLGVANSLESSLSGTAGYEPFAMSDNPMRLNKKLTSWKQSAPP